MNQFQQNLYNQADSILRQAEAEQRGFTDAEAVEFEELKHQLELSISEEKTMKPQGKLKRVAPAVHTKQHRVDPLDYIRHQIDPSSVDFGPLRERSQELGRDVPEELRGNGVYIDRRDLLGGVQKASGTGSGDNMEDLTGIDYADEHFETTEGAITDAAPMGGLPITEVTTNERTLQIPIQLTQASVGSVAVDAALPNSADPTFSTKTTSPHKRGALSQALLSVLWAKHPPFSILQELGRAYVQETNRVMVFGDALNTGEYDGLKILATAAAKGIDVSDASLSDSLSIVQEMADYMQEDLAGDAAAQWLLHPHFINLLSTVPSFPTSTEATASLMSGVWASLGFRRNVGLPITTGTPDTSDGFLVGKPSSIVHVNYGVMRLDSNPWESDSYSKSAFKLRVYGLDDFVLVDPKKVLKFTCSHADTTA